LLALCASTGSAANAATFECRTTDGVYRSPGSTKLAAAGKRDPKIIGTVFTVERGAARVVGSSLFQTDGKRVERIRDGEDIYELLWHSEHRDVISLRLAKFNGSWSFSYYSGWLGLLLAGSCREL
jgi:hypothetical protein